MGILKELSAIYTRAVTTESVDNFIQWMLIEADSDLSTDRRISKSVHGMISEGYKINKMP